ncbi:lF-82 [Enterobacteriaceae bacterium 4M9]|nr:lF-82 [Enterobacteriaceae bacterium 4M9]
MGRDRGYDIIYRGEQRDYIRPGTWVFVQRAKCYGGGYWLGRAYDDCFWLEFETPTSLSAGIDYLIAHNAAVARSSEFVDCDDDPQMRLL